MRQFIILSSNFQSDISEMVETIGRLQQVSVLAAINFPISLLADICL